MRRVLRSVVHGALIGALASVGACAVNSPEPVASNGNAVVANSEAPAYEICDTDNCGDNVAISITNDQ